MVEDSVVLKKDTLKNKGLKVSKDAITERVKYKAEDSVRFEINAQKVFLYQDAELFYGDIILKANYVEINLKDNILQSNGTLDSTGKLQGKPIFSDGEQEFKARELKYNLKTKKGKITDVSTKQDQGFLLGDVLKKDSEDNMYLKTGKYTTCENEDPHFYFKLKKVKVVKNKQIVSGPADLYVAEIPTPLAVPFGFFPNKKGRSNGIILPRPFNSEGLGIGLEEFGYYLGLSDNLDLTLSADVYSRGSYRARAASIYAKRYKYSGNLNIGFANILTGQKGFPNYAINRDTRFTWVHNQDPKARPDSRFSANVTVGKINNIAQRSLTDYVQNNFASTISYTKLFTGTPFSLTAQGSQDQNSQTRRMNIRLPQMVFNMMGINPLGSKFIIGKPKFITDLRLSYQADLRNTITTTDTSFVNDITKNLKNVLRNGLNHTATLNTNLRLLKYFTLTPNLNYSESWYMQTIRKEVVKVGENDTLITRNVEEFAAARNMSFGTNLNTIIYGFYQFKKGPVKGFRHQLTPTISYAYTPKLNKEETLMYQGKQITYSKFENGVFGAPGQRASSILNFGLNNLLSMKYISPSDSEKVAKKVNILDALSVNSSYNFLADSMKLSPFSINARTILFNNININYNATVNPYALDNTTGRVTKDYDLNKNNRIGRITNQNLAVTFTLRSKQNNSIKNSPTADKDQLEQVNRNRDDYVDFNIPYSFSFSYNIVYDKQSFTPRLTQNLAVNADVSITPKWKVTCATSYDFVLKDIVLPNFTVYRDLHCWDLRFNFIPYGPRKSYSIDLNVKASILQDLKLSRKKDWYDAR